MIFHEYPRWSGAILNYYWYLRYFRSFQEARRRKQYRLIAAEKKRLHETGVDSELVRLLCRHAANPRNPHAAKRFWDALHKPAQSS